LADLAKQLNPLLRLWVVGISGSEKGTFMKAIRFTLPLLALTALPACTTQSGSAERAPPQVTPASPPSALPVTATQVRDQAALEKLRGNSGLTLQWIGWDRRGALDVSQRGPVVHLKGAQVAPDGIGRLEVEGDVLSIEADRFTFVGRIAITNSPDAGRRCIKNGAVEFAITQGRKYWRMREFEWCDQLTDYIDIYF
jgi:hypothetical protein